MLAQPIFPAETINRAKVPTSFNAGNLTVDNTGSYASVRLTMLCFSILQNGTRLHASSLFSKKGASLS